MTHTFFASMGGFALHDEQGIPLRILEPIVLEGLCEAGELNGYRSPRRKFKIEAKAIAFRKGSFLYRRVGLLSSVLCEARTGWR